MSIEALSSDKFNIGRWTVKGICKNEDKLTSFQMAKCEMGMSKSTKITLEKIMLDKLDK